MNGREAASRSGAAGGRSGGGGRHRHGYVLRTPWYAREPEPGAGGEGPGTPVIQAFRLATAIRRFLVDPAADDADEIPSTRPGGTPPAPGDEARRVLYQGTDTRHLGPGGVLYLVAIELACDLPGLPSPQRPDATVSFVVRRLSELADQGPGPGPPVPPVLVEQAWLPGAPGLGRWQPATGQLPLAGEAEHAMHAVPAGLAGSRTGTRSLWFGVVPTLTGERQDATAQQAMPHRFDTEDTYLLRCLARWPPGSRPEGRPSARVAGSGPSEPYQLEIGSRP